MKNLKNFESEKESIFVPDWILEWIRCPQSGERLLLASQELIADVDRLARDGKLFDTMGRTISKFSSQGLISENGRWLYKMENNTPSLLADEAVELSSSARVLK